MAWKTWGDAYNAYLAKGHDNGSAAFKADEWEKRRAAREQKKNDEGISKLWGLLLKSADEVGHWREPGESEYDFLQRLVRRPPEKIPSRRAT